LAYQKGDVAKNIEDLTQSVSNAATLISNAKTDIETKKAEIDGIITQAREASAAAGAAVFTKDFDTESKDQKKAAFRWLLATGVLGFLTLLAAIATWWIGLTADFDGFNAIQAFGGKIAILVVFFTATLWCGRVYRALMHQATLNRHRALGLQTFQAFSAAASDDASKDAVLLETTRSIFSAGTTGYLDTQDQGSAQAIRLSEGSRHPVVIKTVELASKSSDK
jgi:ABC-type multidrug transport system fused ATPase/permease subunit